MVDETPRPAVLFNRDVSQWPMSYTMIPPQDDAPRQWWSHTYYRGPGDQPVKVLYSRTKSESEAVAKQFAEESVLGFDMEWPWDSWGRPRLQDKVALIQLASEEKIALFHIALHEGETADDLIAPTLKEIIESSTIIKTGVNILNADFRRLKEHFNLTPRSAFELSHLHNLITYGATAPRLVTTRLCALAKQVEQHLGLPLYKENVVRMGNWSLPLNDSQTQYAATDAYSNFMLFHYMNSRRLTMDPVPPFPRHVDSYPPAGTRRSKTVQLESVAEDGEVRIVDADDFFYVGKTIDEYFAWKAEQAEGTAGVGNSNPESTPQTGTGTESRKRKSSKLTVDQSDLKTTDLELYSQLARHRNEFAMSNGVERFQVACNRVLEALAHHRPSNEEELLLVWGVGKVKVEQHGAAWLEIIAAFQTELKQAVNPETEQDVGGPADEGGDDANSEERDPKRRRVAPADCPEEIDGPPSESRAVLTQVQEDSSLANKPPLSPQCRKHQDPNDSTPETPTKPPLPRVLRPERDTTYRFIPSTNKFSL
ncbi:ribonuclease H-like domain-containing protein [Xylaria palmicola]|nr:ribonuclease H-like domain-containing protein [Xylaria palmicola]